MTGDGRLFDAYIFIDWSAASRVSRAKPRKDAIWIGEYAAGDATPTECYCRTREAGLEVVLGALHQHLAASRRVLAGFDFPYGYPAGFARALGLASPGTPWHQVWRELSSRVVDEPTTNVSNRFAVASALNARIGPLAPGPFWGTLLQSQETPTLSRKRLHTFPYDAGNGVSLERLRLTDQWVAGVQEVWKLAGAGSVGSQALVGIPRVHRLREHPELRDMSRVWPFETGFTPIPVPARGPAILHAEIWPGIVPKASVEAEVAATRAIRDQAQVRLMCRWAADLDDRGRLGAFFDTPPGLGPAALRQVVEEEGWILGAPLTAARIVPRTAS